MSERREDELLRLYDTCVALGCWRAGDRGGYCHKHDRAIWSMYRRMGNGSEKIGYEGQFYPGEVFVHATVND